MRDLSFLQLSEVWMLNLTQGIWRLSEFAESRISGESIHDRCRWTHCRRPVGVFWPFAGPLLVDDGGGSYSSWQCRRVGIRGVSDYASVERLLRYRCARCKARCSLLPDVNPEVLTFFIQGGLMFLKDMFFFHEHARKINLWQSAVIVSPFFGPLFAAFIIAKESWYWPFIIYTIETALAFILVIFFVEETYYDRRIPPSQRPPRGSRLGRLVGTAQRRAQQPSNTFLEAMARPVKVLSKPVIVLTNVYYLLTFAWAVGINSTLAQFLAPVYQFTPTSIGSQATQFAHNPTSSRVLISHIGYFYFIPIVATALGELSGHYIHDALASLSARRNAGTLHPEARLYVLYLATPFIIAGLLLLGFALEHTWHYMLAGLGFGLYSFGIMWCSVGVNAYLLDAYPEAAGEVAAWINFGRTTGGFIVGYFNVEWARNEGPARSFATQAGICAAAFLLVLVLQVWGRRLRQWGGPLKFKTS